MHARTCTRLETAVIKGILLIMGVIRRIPGFKLPHPNESLHVKLAKIFIKYAQIEWRPQIQHTPNSFPPTSMLAITKFIIVLMSCTSKGLMIATAQIYQVAYNNTLTITIIQLQLHNYNYNLITITQLQFTRVTLFIVYKHNMDVTETRYLHRTALTLCMTINYSDNRRRLLLSQSWATTFTKALLKRRVQGTCLLTSATSSQRRPKNPSDEDNLIAGIAELAKHANVYLAPIMIPAWRKHNGTYRCVENV